MLHILTRQWDRLLGLGNDYLISRAHLTLGRIFNIIILLLILLSTASLANEIVQQHYYGTINNLILCSIIFTIGFLKFRGELWISSLLFNIILPIGVSGLAVLYSNVQFLEFYFCSFIIFGVLYSQKEWLKYFFVCYNMGLFCLIYWYHLNNDSITGNSFHALSNTALFINFSLCFLVLIFQIVNKLFHAATEIDTLNQRLLTQNHSLSEDKEELMRLVSHDLRAPLLNIKGFVQIIDKKVKKQDISKLTMSCHFVIQGIEKMEKMISESLLLAKNPDHPQLEKEAIDLNELVEEIESDLKSKYDDFTLSKKNLPTIQSNYIVYKKIFQNLIQNGIKYNTSPQKHMKISYLRRNGHIIYQFEDNGIGIPKEQHQTIFEKYNRGSHDKKYEGTGLGLAITKQMVEKLNGKIMVESAKDEGSKFTITLPSN